MGETVDRKDYLKEQDKGMQTRLMGGFNKLFKVEYQPIGFSWMVYADRTDFDRSHYEFHYIRREFLGDVRCLVFDVTPRRTPAEGASSAASGLKIRNITLSGSTALIILPRAIPTSSTWIAGAST